jgi:hypothetical protein
MPSRRPFLLLPHAAAIALFHRFPYAPATKGRRSGQTRQFNLKATPAKENSRFFFTVGRDGLLLEASGSHTRLPFSSSRRRRPAESHGTIQIQPFGILYTAKTLLKVLGNGSRL